MSSFKLKRLLKKQVGAIAKQLLLAFDQPAALLDEDGSFLLGSTTLVSTYRQAISTSEGIIGAVTTERAMSEKERAIADSIAYLLSQELEKKRLALEILEKYRELNLMYSLSDKLTVNLEPSALGELALQEAARLISMTYGSIMLFDESSGMLETLACTVPQKSFRLQPGIGIAGEVFQTGRGEIVNNITEDRRFVRREVPLCAFLSVPLRTTTKAIGVASFGHTDAIMYLAADLQLLTSLAIQVAQAIANVMLTRRHIEELIVKHQIAEQINLLAAENLRMSSELEVTRRLQQMILPKESELAQLGELDIASFMEPANEVGGDYFDVLSGDGRVKIGIGDVTGHGLESGVLMLMVQASVRTLHEYCENNPVKFLSTINRSIYKNVQRIGFDRHLSLLLLDYHDGLLHISGQHEEALLVRANGGIERIDTSELGFPIGLELDIEKFVHPVTVALGPDDMLVLYTDGVTEAENPTREFYGMERLCATALRHQRGTAATMVEAIVNDLRNHIGPQQVLDDITLVVVKRRETRRSP